MPSHKIEALNTTAGLVRCLCGWTYRLESPNLWGSRSAQDALLDQYNTHKSRPMRIPRRATDSDEE